MIKIAKVVTTRGIKGEIKLVSFSNISDLFESLSSVIIGDAPYKIEHVKYVKNCVILKLAGIENPEDARAILVGKDVYVNDEDMPELENDSYYVKDMIDMEVYEVSGEYIGKIKSIFFTPANDVYEIEQENGKTVLVPAVKEFVENIDMTDKKMTVNLIEGMI
ncbi:MAG: 16S rRNA processing protein RimM [Clostridia bacterium]|nr:16S rRNA processing protein RimM [Clostridia bacterium]